MRFLRLIAVLACAVLAARAERSQRPAYHPRRAGQPPPYAVQMEPIVHYSQRDPLYSPLPEPKSDEQQQQQPFHEEAPGHYHTTEPEPIIEIIIKESNETLPTPPPPPRSAPKKEPIQVFYVKYEKKQEQGEERPRLVYDAPVPAITPVEEHEEIEPPQPSAEIAAAAAELPSTTLRTVIRPDSEVYHSGSSGIRVTFGAEQLPPNNHNKRSDAPPGSSKRPHGPSAQFHSAGRVTLPAFGQQRNSFGAQQFLGGQPLPPHYQQSIVPPHLRNPQFQQRPQQQQQQQQQQRLPITVQGLPDVLQRLPFNAFVPPHRLNLNQQHHHQQLPPSQQPANFHFEPQFQYNKQQQQQQQQFQFTQKPVGGEILKAIPKLEQHYAIRENPQHPGPFPPNPHFAEVPLNSFNTLNALNPNQFPPGPLPQSIQSQKPVVKQQQPVYKSQQSFFLQNLPPPQQQQRPQEALSPQPASVWARPVFQSKPGQKIYATPPPESRSKLTASSTTTTTVAPSPLSTEAPAATQSPGHEAKVKENIANLPDEVPDDIREQLLSSGILGNADIQILDYDKVGGINVGDLPPEALANFYGAASEPVAQVKRPKLVRELQVAASSAGIRNSLLGSEDGGVEEVTLRPGGVEMKVVRFDPSTVQGQSIVQRQIADDATRLGPVALVGGEYNRYLPLKVSGASFPIPEVAELRGKRISSVVVLAPVDYEQQRQSRKLANDVQAIRFLAGDSLKHLVRKPSADNYKRWLEQERQTEPQRQSVVLLVAAPSNDSDASEKEIFMYDVTSESVSKLAGDLSSAFVDAAESNADVNEDPMADMSSN